MVYNPQTLLLAGTASAAMLVTTASGDFIGFNGLVEEVNDHYVVKMYAVYDRADIALNIFNANITIGDGLGFHHSDVQLGAGGTWSPTASLDIPGFADSSIDSFVNLGYGVGTDASFNGTSLDPTFIDASVGLGPYVPAGAGWFNGNPANDIVAGNIDGVGDYAVWVGQFSFSTDRFQGAYDSFFTFDCEIGSKDASGDVFFGSDTFILFPTPGALALLGLGGLTTRRRRL